MIVNFEDGRKFRVWWRYSRDERPGPKGSTESHRRNTACYVRSEAGNTMGDEWVGDALLHFRDQFNPVKGRKISLAKVLKNIGFDQFEREVFWTEFKATTNYYRGSLREGLDKTAASVV